MGLGALYHGPRAKSSPQGAQGGRRSRLPAGAGGRGTRRSPSHSAGGRVRPAPSRLRVQHRKTAGPPRHTPPSSAVTTTADPSALGELGRYGKGQCEAQLPTRAGVDHLWLPPHDRPSPPSDSVDTDSGCLTDSALALRTRAPQMESKKTPPGLTLEGVHCTGCLAQPAWAPTPSVARRGVLCVGLARRTRPCHEY